MEVKLNADHTNELFDKMSNLISEAILRFTEDGLEVTTADPALVSMIHLEVPESSFEEYDIDTDNEEYEHLQEEDEDGLLIGVNIENLSAIVKLFDEEITFTTDEENHLVLKEGNDRFEIPILNLSTSDIPNIDELEHNIKADLTTDQFKTIVNKLDVASDSTTLTLNEEGRLEVEGGNDQISVETSFELENAENLQEDTEVETAQSMFALDYLKKAERMFRAFSTCDNLEFRMGEDFPLDMTHEDDRETLKFVLAPRIEEE